MFARSVVAALAAAASAGIAAATPTPQLAQAFPAGFGPRPFQLSTNSSLVSPDVTSPDASAPTFYSSNWAGIINTPASGTHFTSAVGTFNVPKCSKGASGNGPWYNAYWVGIDGYKNGKALLQAGVICEITSAGVRSYVPWVEFFPKPLVTVGNFPIKAGDKVTVTVDVLSPTKGRLIVADGTSGHSFTTTVVAPAATNTLTGSSAEWIVEDFSSGGGLVPFAAFSPTTFTKSSAKEANGGTVNAYTSGETVTLLENSAGKVIVSVAEAGVAGLTVKYTG